METALKATQNGSKKRKKRRSQEEKMGRRKWIIRKLKQVDATVNRIDRRTRMLAAGLRELLILDEDYISMVACKDGIDHAILNALREARHMGLRTGELAAELELDHRQISQRIYRMNKRMEDEIGEPIITKQKGKWRLIKKLRRDFDATSRGKEIEEKREKVEESTLQ